MLRFQSINLLWLDEERGSGGVGMTLGMACALRREKETDRQTDDRPERQREGRDGDREKREISMGPCLQDGGVEAAD